MLLIELKSKYYEMTVVVSMVSILTI